MASFTVNTTSDTVARDTCENQLAGCSLRGAIIAANAAGNSRINFSIPTTAAGCSFGVCTIRIDSALPTITGSNITIQGPGADRLTVRAANGLSARVFFVDTSSGTTTISGLTVANGTTTINSSGGGIAKLGPGALELVEMRFYSNEGATGGAIYANGGTVRISRSAFEGNFTHGSVGGGAIHVAPGSTCALISSTLVLNSSTNGAGGAITNNGVTYVVNSTVTQNFAHNGGGLFTTGVHFYVQSSIIARNFSSQGNDDVAGIFDSDGWNLVGKVDGSTGFTEPTDLKGTHASPLDPRFDPQRFNTYNGGHTPTIPILPNSPAIDKGSIAQIVGATTMDQRGGFFGRTRDNPRIPNAPGGGGVDIGAYERNPMSMFDFDGDTKADIGVFHANDGTWWINRSSDSSTFAQPFGVATDKLVPADYTGDGKVDVAIWRPSSGEWFILRSETNSYFGFPFGASGDVPTPADYDGDGRADAAVFRPATGFWHILRSTGGTSAEPFGTNGDIPVANDYDGDGRADVAIYRPSVGQWWLSRSTAGVIAYSFGNSTDKIVPGDYTGDGKTDVAFWRPATGQWFVLRSENSSFFSAPFGASTDIPTPGDYDGDGKFDVGVFRPAVGTWFIQRTSAGSFAQQFGGDGDRPLPTAFLP